MLGSWLEMAFKVGDQKQLKLKALDDHDLGTTLGGDWGDLALSRNTRSYRMVSFSLCVLSTVSSK